MGSSVVSLIWEPTWEPCVAASCKRPWTGADEDPDGFLPDGPTETVTNTTCRSTEQTVGDSTPPCPDACRASWSTPRS